LVSVSVASRLRGIRRSLKHTHAITARLFRHLLSALPVTRYFEERHEESLIHVTLMANLASHKTTRWPSQITSTRTPRCPEFSFCTQVRARLGAQNFLSAPQYARGAHPRTRVMATAQKMGVGERSEVIWARGPRLLKRRLKINFATFERLTTPSQLPTQLL